MTTSPEAEKTLVEAKELPEEATRWQSFIFLLTHKGGFQKLLSGYFPLRGRYLPTPP